VAHIQASTHFMERASTPTAALVYALHKYQDRKWVLERSFVQVQKFRI
jgi:hypothetical protein